MIIALLALSLAMIGGGMLAAFTGWDIVLVERGWTMVIAGSVMMGSGALLLGITAAVSKLAKIQRELSHLRGAIREGASVAPQPASTGLSFTALSGGRLGGKALSQPDAEEQDSKESGVLAPFADGNEPELKAEPEIPSGRLAAARLAASVLPFSSRQTAKEEPSDREDAQDLKVPDFLLAERLRETDVETRISGADASLDDTEPAKAEPEPEWIADEDRKKDVTLAAWPEPVAETDDGILKEEAAPEKPAPEEPAAEEPRPATVIGTYNSGDNRYVMFPDGSIEAQTPRGVFNFRSLDELKAFIAAGGEDNSSATI